MRNIYICSAVNSFRIETALPHWTVSEFFDELEKFLGVITVVDEHAKVVRFVELNNYFSNPDKEIIDHAALLREYAVEIDEEKSDKDVTSGNVGYDLPSTSDVEASKAELDEKYPTEEVTAPAQPQVHRKYKFSVHHHPAGSLPTDLPLP